MKKILTIAFFSLAAASAFAQDMYDGLRFGDVNYYGSARTMGMGNAVTAVGGDIGTVGINPAGSAVASYSQFSITPAVTSSATTADYSPISGTDDFTSSYKESHTSFNLPQTGALFNYATGNKSGLKSFSLGVLVNTTANYRDRMTISGNNDYTSMCGALAVATEGCNYEALDLNKNAYAYAQYAWPSVLAYNSRLIEDYEDDLYVGTTENIDQNDNIALGGRIRQGMSRNHYGTKEDIVFNAGFNFNDNLFLGVNVGVPVLDFTESICYTETSESPADFQTQFDNMRYRYNYTAEATGIYAKLGVIWLPATGLRLGATFQTPTIMTVNEVWDADAFAVCGDSQYSGEDYVDGEAYSYHLTTPLRFSVGAAYTFSNMLLVSADFERCDFRNMKFREFANDYNSYFEDVNKEIQDYAGATNELRIGVEFKPYENVAARCGYNLKSYVCPDYTDKTSSFSLGAGYYSNGSFFTDFAFRMTKYPQSWYYPYDDYCDVRSTEVRLNKNFFDILLTFGWRF